MTKTTEVRPSLYETDVMLYIQHNWCVWLYKLGSLTWTSSNLNVRWTLPFSCWFLPWRARWSTSESCSRHPVWPSARCHSVFSGRPGGCCCCTFSPHCWGYLGSRGILRKDKKEKVTTLWPFGNNHRYVWVCAAGVCHKYTLTVNSNSACMCYFWLPSILKLSKQSRTATSVVT